MKCQLCRINRALLKARVGDSVLKVCVYCAITERLEVLEAYRGEKEEGKQKRLEKGDQG